MKRIISLSILSLSTLMFLACGGDKHDFIGCWQGESNMVFQVSTKDSVNYTIHNINGDLFAKVDGDTLRGKNALDMEYKMAVKGDSAYYTFSDITLGYKRISESEYKRIEATLQKATLAP